ncbi:MAG: accessory factor UbiK family protein [Arsenophonus sp.]
MIDIKKIERVARQIKDILPKEIRDLGEDFDKNLLAILQSKLEKLDLVSRKEFDIQIQDLLLVHEKILQIEKRIEQLEENLTTNENK